MRGTYRLSLPIVCSLLLLGLVAAGFAFAEPVSAADIAVLHQAAPAQETPMPADHAAHHPEASQAVTGTVATTGTAGMSGMGMGMAGMMSHMGSMHGEAAAVLEAVLAEHGAMMTPEMAADVGHVLGVLESMHAMMQDMEGMMSGGMMAGGMPMGGMMGGMIDESMPMTGTMPMTDTMEGMDHSGMEDMPSMEGMEDMPGMDSMAGMQGMMGMMEMMHGDMSSMMEGMDADMADEMTAGMEDMQARMDDMMAMMAQMQGGQMGAMPGMEGMEDMSDMDHGAMADPEQPFDAQFIDSMIEHHQGAIAMAEQALEEAEHEELVALAEEIIAAQEGEITQMEAWRAEWYPDLPATTGMSMGMGDMQLAADETLPFDRRFIEAMIAHHRGAISMAQMALEMAEHEEIATLAQAIISAQEAEVEQLTAWNAEWYPDLPALPAAGMDMGQMGAMHSQMKTMMADMQAMMDAMMADDSAMMTPEMAAQMGRMMGRMEGMAGMMHGMEDMMQGGMMETPAAAEESSGD